MYGLVVMLSRYSNTQTTPINLNSCTDEVAQIGKHLNTLTCQIIMQQILLFFGGKNTYTALLGPTRLLISEKPDTYTIKWSYTIILQVGVIC